jgi:GrpB-like predicted nucleotidyltransferase (UPF0157 family)
MLGLRRGTVRLVPHHTEWARLFLKEKGRLNAALGDRALDIQHVGSTAVPGLDAKPILDIAVAVADMPTVTECVPLLEALGYTYFGDRSGKGDYFFAKGEERSRTHYIHMAEHTGPEWTTMLRFRDYLIANPAARQRYSDLKHGLAQQHAADRQAYTAGKEAFIQAALREASSEVGSPVTVDLKSCLDQRSEIVTHETKT